MGGATEREFRKYAREHENVVDCLRSPGSGSYGAPRPDLLLLLADGRLLAIEHKKVGGGSRTIGHSDDGGEIDELHKFADWWDAEAWLCCRWNQDTNHYMTKAPSSGPYTMNEDNKDEYITLKELLDNVEC